MTRNKILDATTKLVAILEPLESEDRSKALTACLTVLGEATVPGLTSSVVSRPAVGAANRSPLTVTEKGYIDQKDPQNKGEELAVAAKFREEHSDATTSTKEELRAVIKAARRNFDDSNFKRDLDNARVKGLFNRGTGKDAAVLSHYGQNYVDAMPDREAVSALSKPKGAGRRSSAKKTPPKRSAK